ELIEKARRYTLGTWQGWAELYAFVLARRRGDQPKLVEPGMGLQADALPTFDGTLLTEDAERRALDGRGGGAKPELLRCAGSRLIAKGSRGAPLMLGMAIQQARAQSALMWELRAATTLAEYHALQTDFASARAVLEPVYGRLKEGADVADARHAREVL